MKEGVGELFYKFHNILQQQSSELHQKHNHVYYWNNLRQSQHHNEIEDAYKRGNTNLEVL